jgi:HK97 family phage portal protein
MAFRNIVANMIRPILRAVEGQPRPGPWVLPVSGGFLPADVGSSINWWQNGHSVQSMAPSAMVEACISAYSQTTAMCPGDHWLSDDEGGRDRVMTSDLARILRKPNAYQSISDFMLNATRSLYADGNFYALALRNSRQEVAELHLMDPKSCMPMVAYNGEIFFQLGGNPVIDRALPEMELVPARDVLHIKMNTRGSHDLRGVSPLVALARDMSVSDAIGAQQLNFYMNQARPSIVLSTDLRLDKAQTDMLRQKWDEQSRGVGIGGTPILSSGLKPYPINVSSADSQLADVMKISDSRIALAYRIPLQMFGLGGGPMGSTEALMQMWIASGLGFCLNHIEEGMGLFFKLNGVPEEYLEYDTSVLLRSAFKDRIEAYVRSVQGGIHAPNEARAAFDMEQVEFGDEPRVQQQVVPLSAAGKIPASPAPGAPPPAAPAALEEDKPPKPPDEPKGISDAERTGIISRFRSSHANSLSI